MSTEQHAWVSLVSALSFLNISQQFHPFLGVLKIADNLFHDLVFFFFLIISMVWRRRRSPRALKFKTIPWATVIAIVLITPLASIIVNTPLTPVLKRSIFKRSPVELDNGSLEDRGEQCVDNNTSQWGDLQSPHWVVWSVALHKHLMEQLKI